MIHHMFLEVILRSTQRKKAMAFLRHYLITPVMWLLTILATPLLEAIRIIPFRAINHSHIDPEHPVQCQINKALVDHYPI
ncbi:hypothetical protein GQ44DRAFT_702791 [Phaeosphaeriaceae sp. PMI808]|nr:hypothetical protein GQ44DRAFT_702791 [Phaeosphaeriaceae sp. PMI808]